jgi:hypothetical protein
MWFISFALKNEKKKKVKKNHETKQQLQNAEYSTFEPQIFISAIRHSTTEEEMKEEHRLVMKVTPPVSLSKKLPDFGNWT